MKHVRYAGFNEGSDFEVVTRVNQDEYLSVGYKQNGVLISVRLNRISCKTKIFFQVHIDVVVKYEVGRPQTGLSSKGLLTLTVTRRRFFVFEHLLFLGLFSITSYLVRQG